MVIGKKWLQSCLCLFFLFVFKANLLLAASPIDEVNRRKTIDSVFADLEVNLIVNTDSIRQLVKNNIEECVKLDYEVGIAKGYYILGKSNIVGAYNYPLAYDFIYKAQRIYEKNKLSNESAKCNIQLGLINYLQRNFGDAEECFSSALNTFAVSGDTIRWRRTSYLYSLCASERGEFANAARALSVAKKFINVGTGTSAYREYYYGRGVFFARQNQNDSAIANLLIASERFSEKNDAIGIQLFYGEIAHAYFNKGDDRNARIAAEKVITASYLNNIGRGIGVIQAHHLLYELDSKEKKYKDAAEHLSKYVVLRDSMVNERKTFELATIKSKYEISKAEQENKLEMAKQTAIQDAQVQKQRLLKNLFIVGCFLFVILILFLIYANNIKKKKNAELATSLELLKTTQEQLIRQEKLASMGKLSAGIAHEIRNPINFIINFSELSEELLSELSEVDPTKDQEALIKGLHDAMQKIKLHGKRADGIVKNMLDHSRSLTPLKELCNINTLCENYLSMAMNAVQVHAPDFTCKIDRMYDSNLPEINIVAADIGRVLLNIFNNAFHAVDEKASLLKTAYTPTLLVSTSKKNDNIILLIQDNGVGIPDKIKDQIFEPFFTTKPAGQGTGLGLSISNEIVKVHNGEMAVESKPGEFTRFVISIPF